MSLAHLNTQSISLVSDGFYVTLQQNQFGFITPSETWFQDNKYLLGYV